MNKKLLGSFFVVILAVMVFLAYPFHKKGKRPPPIFVEITKEKKPKKMLDLAKQRPSKKLRIEDIKAPCHKIISLFTDITFSEIRDNAEQIINLGSSKICQKYILSTLKNTIIENLMKECLKNVANLNSRKCDYFLINFRAWAINASFPDNNPAGLDDTVLINKFLWNFTNNPEFKLDKLDKSLSMIDELISRRPDLFSAYKAKLIPLFLKETQHKQDIREELNATLDALKSLGKDEQVSEFPIVLNLNQESIDEEQTRAHIDNLIKEHPKSSRGYYYLAALEWKKHKNLNGTKKYLKKALELNPQDRFVKDSLNSIKKSKDGKPTFYFSIDFNFQNL